MKERTEFASILKDFNFDQLRKLRAEIERYHADGGKKTYQLRSARNTQRSRGVILVESN